MEKPDNWARDIQRQTSGDGAAYYDKKQEFWTALLDAYPELGELGVRPWRYPNNYVNLSREPWVDLSIYLARHESGAFVRSGRGEPAGPIAEILEPHKDSLEATLGARFGPSSGRHFLVKTFPKGHAEEEAWPEIMSWMKATVVEYRAALEPIFREDDLTTPSDPQG